MNALIILWLIIALIALSVPTTATGA